MNRDKIKLEVTREQLQFIMSALCAYPLIHTILESYLSGLLAEGPPVQCPTTVSITD